MIKEQVDIDELVGKLGAAIHDVLERLPKGHRWEMTQVMGVDELPNEFPNDRAFQRNGTATIIVKINGGAKDSGS